MEKTILTSAKIPQVRPGQIMSHGVQVKQVANLVFVSGQAALDENRQVVGMGDVGAQTRYTLEKIKAVLEEAGASIEDITKVTVFVTNIKEDFGAIHEARAEFWKKDFPASTMVEVQALAVDGLRIEIDAIATIP